MFLVLFLSIETLPIDEIAQTMGNKKPLFEIAYRGVIANKQQENVCIKGYPSLEFFYF